MKTIILVRHSQPEKNKNISNEEICISDEGIALAKKLFSKSIFNNIDYVYTSTYKRAYQTALLLSNDVIKEYNLIERKIGNKKDNDFWEKQYIDLNYKNIDGESFNEVKERITKFINEILFKMSENEKIVFVSHAAAICCYLMNFCEIKVLDSKTKQRKITFNNKTILSGKIEIPSAFVLGFEENILKNIMYMS